MLLERWENIHT